MYVITPKLLNFLILIMFTEQRVKIQYIDNLHNLYVFTGTLLEINSLRQKTTLQTEIVEYKEIQH